VWLTRLVRGLSSLQIYVGDEQFAAGSQLTLADCELAPALFSFRISLPPMANRVCSMPIRRSIAMSRAATATWRSAGYWPKWRRLGSSGSWRENVASRLGDSTAASRDQISLHNMIEQHSAARPLENISALCFQNGSGFVLSLPS
jgi:hypothetical protein